MRIKGTWFKDEQGRTLILRGVNLGGSSKVPFRPDGSTHIRDGFYDHRNVSFVGRPFPLNEADEHLSRLRRWGMTFVRFLITWEAVEHAGPGLYDLDYIDYVYEIVRKAGEYGISLFIDPHQDVWSRMSGGDGAPGWTLEVAGMDVTQFSEAGAAIVHATHGDPFPRMIWPTNYTKLAAATMFTLFFGGNDFAPRTLIDGEPAQEYLQRHYLAAIKQIVRRLRGLPNVVGYDTLNEPSAGYIGWQDLSAGGGMLRLGDSPTPYQSMLLGDGLPQEVEVWGLGLTGLRRSGTRLINAVGARAWLDGAPGLWRENGVWDIDPDGRPRLLRPHHFARVDERPVRFGRDYLVPFFVRYAREIRSEDSNAIIFLEPPPQDSDYAWGPVTVPDVVHAAHWYDGVTLLTKRYLPFLAADFHTGSLVVGRKNRRRSFARQLARIKAEATQSLGGIPTLLGEFGIPFDMQGRRAYRDGDYGPQRQALNDTLQSLDANLLSGTLWNYTGDNSHEHGDRWNGEDFSIFSRDDQSNPSDPYDGGRALEAVIRPCACRVAGEPLSMAFDLNRRIFTFSFRHDPAVNAPTEIFVPSLHYPQGCLVTTTDGEAEIDRAAQIVYFRHELHRPVHEIQVRPAP